jgi:hypothetical protein
VILFLLAGNQKILAKLKIAQTKSASKIKLIMGLSMLLTGLILLIWLMV